MRKKIAFNELWNGSAAEWRRVVVVVVKVAAVGEFYFHLFSDLLGVLFLEVWLSAMEIIPFELRPAFSGEFTRESFGVRVQINGGVYQGRTDQQHLI